MRPIQFEASSEKCVRFKETPGGIGQLVTLQPNTGILYDVIAWYKDFSHCDPVVGDMARLNFLEPSVKKAYLNFTLSSYWGAGGTTTDKGTSFKFANSVPDHHHCSSNWPDKGSSPCFLITQ